MKQRISTIFAVGLLVSPGILLGVAAKGQAVRQDGREVAGRVDPSSAKIRADAGLIRLGGGNWSELTNANSYGVIFASPANADAAGAQSGRALMYACGTNTPPDQTSALCGVSFAYAAARDWILKDSNGNYVHYKGQYPVLLDIGNPSYQRKFISAIDGDLRTHRGIDGVIIDDIVGSLIAPSVKYPDNASYRAAVLSFLRAVGPALRAKGWYVAVNASILDPSTEARTGLATNGSQNIWWMRHVARYVNGINLEHWQQNWDGSDSVRFRGALGNQAWDGWQRLPGVVQGLGKDFYASEAGPLTDFQKAAYLRASFLLAWTPGRGAFFYSGDASGRGDPWRLTATPAIGRPMARARRVGVGFRRNFTIGTVLLNPDPSRAQTFAFKRTYLIASGTATRSITLPPGTGIILRRAS